MRVKDILIKILAILGTVFVWFPVLAPLLLSVATFTRERGFMVDFLMPAELFPAALLGGVLLLGAALWARRRRGLIGGGLAVSIGLLVGSQALADVTGMASGETEPTPLMIGLVIGGLAIYVLGLVAMGVGGVLLLRDLFRLERPTTA